MTASWALGAEAHRRSTSGCSSGGGSGASSTRANAGARSSNERNRRYTTIAALTGSDRKPTGNSSTCGVADSSHQAPIAICKQVVIRRNTRSAPTLLPNQHQIWHLRLTPHHTMRGGDKNRPSFVATSTSTAAHKASSSRRERKRRRSQRQTRARTHGRGRRRQRRRPMCPPPTLPCLHCS